MATTNGVKQVALIKEPEPEALVTADTAVSMFERLARDPSVDVEKLERLIAMQERIMRHNAKAAFDGAYADMQAEMPEITERGQIRVKDTIRSTYARLEDINATVKPILKQFGFAIRHRTEWPPDRPGIIRIVGILSHRQGHSEESVFEAPMDRSDFRTDIQSQGSTVSYGRRYTTLDLLNIATRGADDDGRKSGRPQPPEGYDDWTIAMSKEAEKGLPALEKMFAAESSMPYRGYLTQHDAEAYRKMRTRARTGKADAS